MISPTKLGEIISFAESLKYKLYVDFDMPFYFQVLLLIIELS